MRQAGILAAAALWALEHNVDRLAEDHRNARRLADGLVQLPGVRLALPVETNMVFAELPPPAPGIAQRLAAEGVLCNAVGERVLRMVTHLDVSQADVDEALARIRRVLAQLPRG